MKGYGFRRSMPKPEGSIIDDKCHTTNGCDLEKETISEFINSAQKTFLESDIKLYFKRLKVYIRTNLEIYLQTFGLEENVLLLLNHDRHR